MRQKPSRGQAAFGSAAAGDEYADGVRSEADARLRLGLAAPDVGVSIQHHFIDCKNEDFSYQDGGFVIDHYHYCLARRLEIEIKICAFRVPLLGCLRQKEIGEANFTMTTRGFGWDGSMPHSPGDPSDPRFAQVSFATDLSDWDPAPWGAALTTVLNVEMRCEPRTTGALCRSNTWERGRAMTVAEWMNNPVGPFFRFLVDPAEGDGPDGLTFWGFDNVLTLEGPNGDSEVVEGNEVRCDNASYLRGGRGCMFNRVESLFTDLSIDNPAHFKAAGHIFDALYRPERTQPQIEGKNIPGSIESARPLRRLFPPYDMGIYNANNAVARSACIAWWGPDYAEAGRFECDEFPFRSTYEGASQAGIHYSVRVIDAPDNGVPATCSASFTPGSGSCTRIRSSWSSPVSAVEVVAAT